YNFRASTYRDSFQYRLEALPPAKCPVVVSDARSIEWCYGKVLLIKHLMADVLGDQVERGFLEPDDALRVAGQWLHGAAATPYRPSGLYPDSAAPQPYTFSVLIWCAGSTPFDPYHCSSRTTYGRIPPKSRAKRSPRSSNVDWSYRATQAVSYSHTIGLPSM